MQSLAEINYANLCLLVLASLVQPTCSNISVENILSCRYGEITVDQAHITLQIKQVACCPVVFCVTAALAALVPLHSRTPTLVDRPPVWRGRSRVRVVLGFALTE
jgi:hypothetical protein